jgi:hypothetical protein
MKLERFLVGNRKPGFRRFFSISHGVAIRDGGRTRAC